MVYRQFYWEFKLLIITRKCYWELNSFCFFYTLIKLKSFEIIGDETKTPMWDQQYRVSERLSKNGVALET